MRDDRRTSRAQAREAGERAAARLSRDPRVLLVYLFGSAVDSDRHSTRDVDLAVLTAPALPADELWRLRADLTAMTGARVDLVSLNEAPVTLAHEVVEAGVCLFARDPDVETDFVTRTRARFWDFDHYRRVQWRLAGERLADRARGS